MGLRKNPPKPARDVIPVTVGDSAGTNVATLKELDVVCTAIEETFARLYTLYNNATQAYVEATCHKGPRASARVMAWEMSNRPHVLRRVREYETAAAAATVIDYAAILDHDRQIVEGHKHADEITQHVWQCCRWCNGESHRYQWVDHAEFFQAIATAAAENEKRLAKKQPELPMPDDSGGYGFSVLNDPNITCPRCEGRGVQITVIADTTKLTGPARVIVKGVRVTNNGSEVLLHDIDKAKDRLLRAGGIYKDDAASVARGAAAGAAAGMVAATVAAAAAAKVMSFEEASRLYLELA